MGFFLNEAILVWVTSVGIIVSNLDASILARLFLFIEERGLKDAGSNKSSFDLGIKATYA